MGGQNAANHISVLDRCCRCTYIEVFRIEEVGTKNRIAPLCAGRDALLPIGDIRGDAPPDPPCVVSNSTVEVAAHEHYVLADRVIPARCWLRVVLIQVLVERELGEGGMRERGRG